MNSNAFTRHLALVTLIATIFMLGATSVMAQNKDSLNLRKDGATQTDGGLKLKLRTEAAPGPSGKGGFTQKELLEMSEEDRWKAVYQQIVQLWKLPRLKAAEAEAQLPNIDSLIEAKVRERLDTLQPRSQPAPAGNTYNYSTVNNYGDTLSKSPAKEPKLPKDPKWDLTGTFGTLFAFHSAPIIPPCDCPHIPVGFNEQDRALSAGLTLARLSNLDTTFSWSYSLSGQWARLDLPNGKATASAMPTLLQASFSPTFARKFGEQWRVFAQPTLWGAHAPKTQSSWAGFNLAFGGRYQFAEKWAGQVIVSLPVAAQGWLPGKDAEKSRRWEISAKATSGVFHFTATFTALKARRGEDQGGVILRGWNLGAGVSF